jgi:hypothetical protein
VSAAVPLAELASYFGERDVAYWRYRMGYLCDELAAPAVYGLEHDEGGCHLSDRDLVLPVCIYVAVDDAGACLYIGQCRRPNGSVVERIDGHHAIPCFSTGLWLLPLHADCPPSALDRLERQMIGAYRPPFNTVYCPAGSRAGALQ